jgi:RNA polymerase sigma factor (sigma-70 family)
LSVTQPPPSTPPHGTTPLSTNANSAPVEIGSALERLMARFSALATRAAQARGLNKDDIDEILQDVRIRLWKAHPQSENLERLGASYFVKVVSSAVVDRLRRQRRSETSLEAANATTVVPDALQVRPPDTTEHDALAVRLSAALALLPRNRRLVVQLHLDGYERGEISGMTGWTEAKVRNLLYRGLDDLRAHLRSDGEPTDA